MANERPTKPVFPNPPQQRPPPKGGIPADATKPEVTEPSAPSTVRKPEDER
jgi:hypothetical protein